MSAKIELLKAILVTAELAGTELSEDAAEVMVNDLVDYPAEQVMAALKRCRLELRGRLTVSEILARLEDGRPGADEAFALIPQGEEQTVVWTDEVRQAYFEAAAPLLEMGDKAGARFAFREAYNRRVTAARQAHIQPRWEVSPGTDPTLRATAIMKAVEAKRLPAAMLEPHVHLLGGPAALPAALAQQLGVTVKAIAGGAK